LLQLGKGACSAEVLALQLLVAAGLPSLAMPEHIAACWYGLKDAKLLLLLLRPLLKLLGMLPPPPLLLLLLAICLALSCRCCCSCGCCIACITV
jgi:hypothetical protein